MKLSDYLHIKGLSDAEFATLVKCDRTTVGRWRARRTRPSPDQIIAIQRVTDGQVDVASWFESELTGSEIQAAE